MSAIDDIGKPIEVGSGAECRLCESCCDKMVEPAACVEMDCPFLYSYIDRVTGSTFMGCIQKVFKVEIDLAMLAEAEMTAGGYGGIKANRTPLPHCPFTVEQAFDSLEPHLTCQNRRFFDCDDTGPGGFAAFDLRKDLAG